MKNRKIGLHTFMAVPAFALYCLFFIYPLTKGIGMSLTNWNGYGQAEFIGLKNFVDFFKDSRAISDIKTTVLFALGSAPLLNIVGLLYALLMNSKFKGKSCCKSLHLYARYHQPPDYGLYLVFASPAGARRYFQFAESDGASRMVPQLDGAAILQKSLCLFSVNVWQYAGMTMIIYLAGLQNISQDLYDAAMIDGATGWQSFRFITLPLLVPSIRINVVTNIIGSLSVFDIVMSLTSGGPGYQTETLSIYIMRMCYGSKTGYSTAVAMIMFLIVLIPVLISLRLTRTKD